MIQKATASYLRAIAALAGTTIGAGIFGVPYVMAQAGPLIGAAWILGLGFILIITNLLHGEFSLRSDDDLKFVGIARKYLNPFWGKFTGILTVISFYGSLLAYVIIGGSFFNTLLSVVIPMTIPIATITYVVLIAFILYKGIHFLERVELPLTLLLVLALLTLSVFVIREASFENFVSLNPSNVLLPYGVVLFSLSSISAIPTIEQILEKNKKALKSAIILSGVISTMVVLFFGLAVVGVTGMNTTQDAMSGLGSFGDGVMWIGALIGFLAIITSHLIIGHHLREIFQFDYATHPLLAWGLAVFIPYMIFLIAEVSFIGVVGFVGGVIGGVTGNLVGYISLRSHEAKTRKPEYCLKNDKFWAYVVMVIFSLGIVYQLYYSIFI